MKNFGMILLLALCWVGPGWVPAAGAGPGGESGGAAGQEAGLKEIRRKIRKEEEVLKRIFGQRKSLLGAIEDLNKEIERARQDCRRAQDEIQRIEAECAGLREEIESIEKQIDKEQRTFEQRLAASHRVGRIGMLPVVFSGGGFHEKVRALESMKRILAANRAAILSYEALVEERKSKVSVLEERLAKERELEQEIEKRREDLAAKKAEKGRLLAKVEQDEKLHRVALKELRDAGDRLERLIRQRQEEERKRAQRQRQREGENGDQRLARKPPDRISAPEFQVPTGESFEACKGKLPWPVQGELHRKFGKQYDAKLRADVLNKGIDIKVEPEAPVKAVWKGSVVFADWFRGYGKLMIIHHGGKSYTVLSCLSRLVKKEGERVDAGEIVGYAGGGGSFEEGIVHFEVWHRGRPQDPLEWIRIR